MPGFMVRDVVDMDVALHGRRFIVVEFVLMIAFGLGFAGLEIYLGTMRGSLISYQLLTGIYVALVTVNCVTFLVLALTSRKPSPPATRRALWLTAAALVLLAAPLAFPLIATLQTTTSGSLTKVL